MNSILYFYDVIFQLSESRVFQSQNQITVKPEVKSDNSIPTTAEAETYASHEHVSNSMPKTGERIDLGLLFKKMGIYMWKINQITKLKISCLFLDTGIRNPAMQGSSNYPGLVNMAQGKTDRNEADSTDGVPGIQQHCQVRFWSTVYRLSNCIELSVSGVYVTLHF